MDLRDRIADAIARGQCDTPASVHPLMEDYRDHADKVMAVMRGETGQTDVPRLARDCPKCDDRTNELFLLYGRERAKTEDLQARVREMEAEKDLLCRQLETARGERPGTWDTWAEHIARKQATPPDPLPKPCLTLEEARKQAADAARARQKEEK